MELQQIHETYQEQELVIEGEYATQAQMHEWGWSELPVFLAIFHDIMHSCILGPTLKLRKRVEAVKKYCLENPAKFMRRCGLLDFYLTYVSQPSICTGGTPMSPM